MRSTGPCSASHVRRACQSARAGYGTAERWGVGESKESVDSVIVIAALGGRHPVALPLRSSAAHLIWQKLAAHYPEPGAMQARAGRTGLSWGRTASLCLALRGVLLDDVCVSFELRQTRDYHVTRHDFNT